MQSSKCHIACVEEDDRPSRNVPNLLNASANCARLLGDKEVGMDLPALECGDVVLSDEGIHY